VNGVPDHAGGSKRVCARDAWWPLPGGPSTAPLYLGRREATGLESMQLETGLVAFAWALV
jgi:hypothetical protein